MCEWRKLWNSLTRSPWGGIGSGELLFGINLRNRAVADSSIAFIKAVFFWALCLSSHCDLPRCKRYVKWKWLFNALVRLPCSLLTRYTAISSSFASAADHEPFLSRLRYSFAACAPSHLVYVLPLVCSTNGQLHRTRSAILSEMED